MSASDKAMFTRLNDNSISAVVSDRVYPLGAEIDDEYPRIAYEVDEIERPRTYEGSSGIVKSDVTVTCEGKDLEQVAALSVLVRSLLDNGRGNWGDVVVQGCFYQSQNQSKQEEEDGGGEYIYSRSLSFTLWVED